MDKIYRRTTQINIPKKRKNEKNRRRNMIMNFRVSPMEKELIEARIKLTGLPKSEFFIESCLYQKILVKGNIKTFKEINDKMREIAQAINKNTNIEDIQPELMESLRIILEILNNLFDRA